ncbi:hypothetical protein AKJ09_02103 [Labilithrix luteola]|uniref:Uncharacterized protein n=1 Tax=Labilithrix luteola TaxID=1391654 RepID=A0A0K1PQP6_9BACT|nr:hypothetical protein [Labilithrix luteola]AKU95439.1 hypothetical protein AKJ09_02103 [Labilithrix luteola]
MRIPFFVAVTSLASLLALAVACSSSTTTVVSGDAGDEEAEASVKDAGKDSSTKDSSTTDKDSSTGSPDDACFAMAKDKCGECCATNHEDGYTVVLEAVLKCACEGTSPACATECGDTVCKDPNSTSVPQACSDCLNTSIAQGGKCVQAVGTACQASEPCMTWQNDCVAHCK